MKWYRKLALELLTGTAVVNAHITYREITKTNISITAFKEQVIDALLKWELPENTSTAQGTVVENEQHTLEDLGRNKRRRCVECYKKIAEESGRTFASRKTPQTTLRCKVCDKHFCLDCFFVCHKVDKI